MAGGRGAELNKRKRTASSSSSAAQLSSPQGQRSNGSWADQSQSKSPNSLSEVTEDQQLDLETPLIETGCPLIHSALSAHGDNTWRSRFVPRVSTILHKWRPEGKEWGIDYARTQDPLKTPQLLVSGPPHSGKGAAIESLSLMAKKLGCFTVVLSFTPDFRNERARDLEARFLGSAGPQSQVTVTHPDPLTPVTRRVVGSALDTRFAGLL